MSHIYLALAAERRPLEAPVERWELAWPMDLAGGPTLGSFPSLHMATSKVTARIKELAEEGEEKTSALCACTIGPSRATDGPVEDKCQCLRH